MTERLAQVEHRIQTVHQLEGVVRAMRGIASTRVQECRTYLVGICAYSAVIAEAIGQALTMVDVDSGSGSDSRAPSLSILFCAEQGFTGTLSELVLVAADQVSERELFMVGTRGALLAEERKIPIAWKVAMASRPDGVPELANRIAEELYRSIADHAIGRVTLMYPVWSEKSGLSVARRRILPYDYSQFRIKPTSLPPLRTLPAAVLLAELVEEHVFAQICEAAMSAFAAENEARLAVMSAAKNNIEHLHARLEDLKRQVRQEEITAEVVELALDTAAARTPSALISPDARA